MRRLLIFPLMPLFLVGHYSGEPRRPILGSDTRIEATAVPLDKDHPGRRSAGALHFIQGWQLKGRDPAFGSFSAMLLQGSGLLFLSDAGGLVRFAIGDDGVIRGARFGDLPDGPGRGWTKADRDTEAMTRDPASGKVWIAFERSNAIWRYSRDLARAEAHAEPEAMRGWPENGGAEAMVRLRSGQFLVFSETARERKKGTVALAFDRDPTDPSAKVTRFFYRAPAGFRVTDAAELPDGRILLSHRRGKLGRFLSASLAVLDPSAIKPGVALTGKEIAQLAPPLTVDNMEALAVTVEHGRTIVWLASDDNFSVLQRTLLMKFSLSALP